MTDHSPCTFHGLSDLNWSPAYDIKACTLMCSHNPPECSLNVNRIQQTREGKALRPENSKLWYVLTFNSHRSMSYDIPMCACAIVCALVWWHLLWNIGALSNPITLNIWPLHFSRTFSWRSLSNIPFLKLDIIDLQHLCHYHHFIRWIIIVANTSLAHNSLLMCDLERHSVSENCTGAESANYFCKWVLLILTPQCTSAVLNTK